MRRRRVWLAGLAVLGAGAVVAPRGEQALADSTTQLVHADHMTAAPLHDHDHDVATAGDHSHSQLENAEYFHLQRPTDLANPSGRVSGAQGPLESGPRPVLVILTSQTGAASSALSRDNAVSVMGEVSAWMNEVSHGAVTMPATVTPYYAVNPPSNCNNPYSFLMSAINAARAGGYNNLNYTHVIAYTPACWSGGLGEVGGSYTWIYASGFNLGVVTHELGHNLGLWHANAFVCANTTMAANDASCGVNEYGDPFSTMGGATGGHFSSYEKGELGWLGANRMQTVTAGTFDLVPYASTNDALRSLHLNGPDGRQYWVEYRAATNRDSVLSMFPNGLGVQVRYQPANPAMLSVPGGLLLDTRPATATFADASIPVGATWSDPTGAVNVRVISMSPSFARVEVQGVTGRPTAPNSVTVTPGNGRATVTFTTPMSNGGSSITGYTVRVTPAGAAPIEVTASASPVVVTGLRNGISHSVSVTASNAAGPGPAAYGDAFTPIAPPGTFTTVAPVRVHDSRQTGIAMRTGSIVRVALAGAGLPSQAAVAAAAVNITATHATGDGYVAAYPCDQQPPATSTLNFARDATVANASIVPVAGGALCLFSMVSGGGTVHAVIDVTGWYNTSRGPDGGAFNAMTPTRVEDTRRQRRIGAGETLVVPIAVRAALPTSATSAVTTLTAVDPQAAGYLTAYACHLARPSTSSLNFESGDVVANTATVGLSPQGTMCVYAYAATDVVVDVIGWYGPVVSSTDVDMPSGARFTGIVPERIYDTRTSSGALPDGGRLVVAVAGRGSVPASGVSAAAVNLTVTDPTGDGYATVYPCDRPVPLASTLNFTAASTVASATIAALAANGTICVQVYRSAHVIVDITGWFG